MAQHPLLILAVASVGDPDGTRTVTSIVALLVALGVALLMLAVWLFKVTRPDPEVLSPLEAMGERKWQRADPVWQRRRLDELRPTGARPLQPSVAPPKIDAAFDLGPAATGFDDLRDEPEQVAEHSDAASAAGADGETHALLPPDPDSVTDAPDAPTLSIEIETPPGILRPVEPVADDFDDEFDPDLLAAAMRDIDAELADSSERSRDD